MATKEEQAEEARRNLIKQLRELEAQLEDERKQRSAAQSAQKKIESELNELESQLEAEAKGREDMQRHYRKAHVSGGEWRKWGGSEKEEGLSMCAVEEERTLESVARWGERKSWKRI